MGKDRSAAIAEERAGCRCEPCPTYNECMRADEALVFCRTGRSANCTFERKGCRCPGCPVGAASGLAGEYPCIRGTGAGRQ